VGFPIRKSTGHRLFAPHRSLSQRTTSFIASCRQGIHRMLLGHLIALISNAHLEDLGNPPPRCAGVHSSSVSAGEHRLLERPVCIEIDPSESVRLARSPIPQSPDPAPLLPQHEQSVVPRPGMTRKFRVLGLSLLHDVKKSAAWWRRKRTLRRWTLIAPRSLVEPDGIEPTTSCLQSRRSPN
jgi:hypothetical protein